MPTDIQKVRMEVADIDIQFPILPDDTYTYLLSKNYNSISKTAMDAARIILMTLSLRSEDTTVDIFSIKGSKAAESYREALKIYLKDPYNNPVLQNVQGWVGGVFLDQMQENIDDLNTKKVEVISQNSAEGLDSFFGV
jgi:hypothetical protein